jgi:hypothetical protein
LEDIVAVLGLVTDFDADTGKIGEMPVETSYVIGTSPGNAQAVSVRPANVACRRQAAR